MGASKSKNISEDFSHPPSLQLTQLVKVLTVSFSPMRLLPPTSISIRWALLWKLFLEITGEIREIFLWKLFLEITGETREIFNIFSCQIVRVFTSPNITRIGFGRSGDKWLLRSLQSHILLKTKTAFFSFLPEFQNFQSSQMVVAQKFTQTLWVGGRMGG